MDGSLPPTDDGSFVARGLADLKQESTEFVERELEREVDELERRLQFAERGAAVLELLRKLEEQS
jgi:hypothetical protein